MDEAEARWAELLMQSVEEIRGRIRFGEDDPVEVPQNMLLHLLNRAEALVETIRRREPQE